MSYLVTSSDNLFYRIFISKNVSYLGYIFGKELPKKFRRATEMVFDPISVVNWIVLVTQMHLYKIKFQGYIDKYFAQVHEISRSKYRN